MLSDPQARRSPPRRRGLIFIATPHRGSRLDWEPIRGIATRVVRSRVPSQQARTSLLTGDGRETFTPRFRAGLLTSLEELSWEHPLLLAIDDLPFPAEVARHSIIADLGRRGARVGATAWCRTPVHTTRAPS